ncbi:MAG: polysaccharide pyruvyl transferase family protein [Rhodospirillales bacterium]|nr:polysaccharide pyruvyl transferase family protein [Rhodospirillales bacterium]
MTASAQKRLSDDEYTTRTMFDLERMTALQVMLEDEFQPLLAGKAIHYLDTPTHLNVGDLLIMLGTEKLFRQLRVKVKTSVSLRSLNVFRAKHIGPEEVIVCHGGGNFGDLYQGVQDHQALRLDVVRHYPHHAIIMMPQSVHFERAEKLQETIEVLKQHRNLLIYVRDQYSYDVLAPELGDAVRMMPDMAHMLLGTYQTTRPMIEKTLVLRRRDEESTTESQAADTFDWDDIFTPADKQFYDAFRFLCRIENKMKLALGSASLWSWYSAKIAKRAESLFSRYHVIDTDRLHGAIFGLLNGRDLILRDNSYGKLGRYFSRWFS